MSAPTRTPVRIALERAAQRLNDEAGDPVVSLDMLDALTQAAEAQVDHAGQGDDFRETTELREENAKLADQLAARQRSLDETETTMQQLRRELEAADDERAELKRQLDAHVHHYPWPDLEELPLPCECSKVHPWFAAEEDTEDVQPELSSWDELMLAVRAEAEAVGFPVDGDA